MISYSIKGQIGQRPTCLGGNEGNKRIQNFDDYYNQYDGYPSAYVLPHLSKKKRESLK